MLFTITTRLYVYVNVIVNSMLSGKRMPSIQMNDYSVAALSSNPQWMTSATACGFVAFASKEL